MAGPNMSSRASAKDMAQKDMAGAQSRVQSSEELKTDPLAREVKAGAKKKRGQG